MKKIMIYVLILATSLSFLFLTPNIQIKAECEEKYAFVIGTGEINVVPDTVLINFGIQKISQTLKDGQENISNTYNKIIEEIKKIDEESDIYLNYSSCYPTCNNGIQGYEFCCNITVKTKKLELINDIIKTAGENGVTSYYNTTYSLENTQELYNQALNLAKENALKKVTSLYKNVEEKEVYELNVFSFSNGNEKIKIEAKVKVKFAICEENNEKIPQNNEKVPQNDEKIEENIQKDIQTLENLPTTTGKIINI